MLIKINLWFFPEINTNIRDLFVKVGFGGSGSSFYTLDNAVQYQLSSTDAIQILEEEKKFPSLED